MPIVSSNREGVQVVHVAGPRRTPKQLAREVRDVTVAAPLVSGETEPTGRSRLVGRIRVPVPLIASNANGERTIDQIYRARIGRTASLWYLPEAGHTRGLSAHPTRYAARVDTFLATALKGR